MFKYNINKSYKNNIQSILEVLQIKYININSKNINNIFNFKTDVNAFIVSSQLYNYFIQNFSHINIKYIFLISNNTNHNIYEYNLIIINLIQLEYSYDNKIYLISYIKNKIYTITNLQNYIFYYTNFLKLAEKNIDDSSIENNYNYYQIINSNNCKIYKLDIISYIFFYNLEKYKNILNIIHNYFENRNSV